MARRRWYLGPPIRFDSASAKREMSRLMLKAPRKKQPKAKAKKSVCKHRPGTSALRDIQALQNNTKLLFNKTEFQRIAREVAQDFKDDLRFQSEAMAALQEAAEHYITELLTNSNWMAHHSNAITVQPRDMAVARRLRSRTRTM